MAALREGLDYYLEDGLYVFTAHYHLRRGYCCGAGCRHCPYPPEVRQKTLQRRLEGRPIRSREEFETLLGEP